VAEFPSLPLFTDAYIADTQHLTNEEHGVYLRLLMFAWRSPHCALPSDDKRLALMVGVTPKKWASLKVTVLDFWTATDAGLQQDRLTFERQRVTVLMDQKSAAGKASARAKSRKTNKPAPTDVTTSVATGGATVAQQPEPYPEKEDKSSSKGEADMYQEYLDSHPKPVESNAGELAFSALVSGGVDPCQLVGAAKSYAIAAKKFSSQSFIQQSDNFLDDDRGKWKAHVAPKAKPHITEDDALRAIAAQIKSGGFFSASSLSAHKARQMLAAGYVTQDQLSQRGIAI